MSKFIPLLLLIICSPVFGHGSYLTCTQETFNYLSQHNAAKSSLRSIDAGIIEIADDGQIFYCTNTKPKIIDCKDGHCKARCGLNKSLRFTTELMLEEGDRTASHVFFSPACRALLGIAK